MEPVAWWALIPIVAILGGIGMAIAGVISRTRIRELEIRERIAMIERGLMPSPEVDPGGYERRIQAIDRVQTRSAAPRFRSAGITLISVGIGLAVMLGMLGAGNTGVGVGGFIAIMGLGFLVNSLFHGGGRPLPPAQPSSSIPPSPPTPPPTQS